MQFALTVSQTESKPVQAGPDAPRYAQCVYCGMPVVLSIQSIDNPSFLWDDIDKSAYSYQHISNLSATECQKLRDEAQTELDKVLNVR